MSDYVPLWTIELVCCALTLSVLDIARSSFPDQPLFPNARGGRLSAHGVHYLLAKHVAGIAPANVELGGAALLALSR